MRRHLKQLIGALGATLALSLLAGLLHASPAAAAGEVYTWKDYRTITVTGGDVKTPSDILLTNTAPSGDTAAVLSGNILYNKGRGDKGCTVSIQIYLFKSSGNGSGRVWNPPPYDSTGIGDPNAAPRCALAGAPEMDPPLHDQWITIGGTRPADPNAAERDEEKRFDVYVFAPDPLSKAPASDRITIYRSDGTQVGSESSPFHDDSGQANWPPDQTPAALRVTFTLEPGDYLVCDTYVAKECNYARAPAAQKFKKEKYKPSSIQLGKPFQTPDKKRINATIEYHTERPCGTNLDVSPHGVTLTGPTGQTYTKLTPPGHASTLPGERDASCTVQVTMDLIAVFDDMPPGNYKACTTGAQCVTFTKIDGEAANVKLVVQNKQTAPPNQKVCTSGDGIAGALAWVICPAVQLIASATTFFENNIIIPFMTISPLTTNENNPIYILWQRFRDFANFGFVILLFVSIFTSLFNKNGFKRLLPSIFIAIIGVNLSYFVVAFIADAFNIFGAGVSQLVVAALQNAGTTQLNSGTSAGPVQSIFVLGGAALLTILLSGGAALGWLFSFLGLAALVVGAVVIILVVRQMLFIGLVVVAPVPFVLYMLPNTREYLKLWWSTIIKLLLMYPQIVLAFAIGKIFGIVLQQPDFKLAGDGVTDDVAQAIRVILQFLVYVLPLTVVPATFASSGWLMSKGYSMLANNPAARKLAQQPGKSFGANVIKPKRDELQMRAARRGGRVGQLAGIGMRREFKRDQREKELQRARQQYLAGRASDPRFAQSAAGIGGQTGATRVQANALNTMEKARKEDVANERAMFEHELNQVGLSTKEFNNGFSDYLRNPSNNIIQGTVRNPDGSMRSIDLSQRQDLMRSAFTSAAQAGEITTLEQGRMSAGVDQEMLDEVIRSNEGDIKSKGGYHLATNFNLANGRSAGTQRDVNIARLRGSFASSGEDIAGMKASFVNATRATLQDPATRAAMMSGPGGLTMAERQTVRDNIDSILASPDIAGGAKNIDALREIRNIVV